VTGLGEALVEGDGVLLHNGQFRHEVVDLYIPCRGFDFVWKRTYQSGSSIFQLLDGELGRNWDFSWGAHALDEDEDPDNPGWLYFSRGDYRRDAYENPQDQSGEKVYLTHPAGYFDIRTSILTGGTTIRQEKRNGFIQTFDYWTGVLKTREDRYGNKYTVIYTAGGNFSRIQDPLGRYIDFTYYTSGVGAGRISTITDFSGREVRYEYEEPVNYHVLLTKVHYPATDWLDDKTGTWDDVDTWTAKSSTARTERYGYDSNRRLTVLIDGRGVTHVKQAYDSSGRVTQQYEDAPNFTDDYYHKFEYSGTGVTMAKYWDREASKTGTENEVHYFNSSHLGTTRLVKYGSTTATTITTRGCSCTLPTAIQSPDNGYKTFGIDSSGNVVTARPIRGDPSRSLGGTSTTAPEVGGKPLQFSGFFLGGRWAVPSFRSRSCV
jgi:hypothetical protein